MFGIGFTELLFISIIAILFLGPDKLPETMVKIAKFMKSVQKTVHEAKNSLEEEMKIADLKEEALNYKKQLDSATNELRSFKNIDYDDILNDEPKQVTSSKRSIYADETKRSEDIVIEKKNDTVTYEKKSRKRKTKKALEKENQAQKDEVQNSETIESSTINEEKVETNV